MGRQTNITTRNGREANNMTTRNGRIIWEHDYSEWENRMGRLTPRNRLKSVSLFMKLCNLA